MSISCLVTSYSHTFNSEVFSFLEYPQVAIKVSDVKENSFILSWDTSLTPHLQSEHEWLHGHIAISSFLVSLSIATIGTFTPANWSGSKPIYEHSNLVSGERSIIGLNFEHDKKYDELISLTDLDVENAIIIFVQLTNEKESISRNEYIKGLMNLTTSYYDINFHKEAYANFYRSLEYFVTRKILGVNKLSNEHKDIRKVLKEYGACDMLLDEFKKLYITRSSQVMHAQNEQLELTFDEAIKMKTYADFVMHQYYRQAAEKIRSEFKNV